MNDMQNDSKQTESAGAVSSTRAACRDVLTEGYPPNWMRVVLMVSPDGKEAYAIGGDRAPGDGDRIFYGYEHVRKWLHAYNNPPLPWWRKDRHGWPIETFKGKPVKSAMRLICQNIRKMMG